MQAEQEFKQIKKSIIKDYIMKVLSSLIEQDKENKQNIANKNNLIQIKQNIKENSKGYFIRIASDIKLRNQITRKLLQLQSNASKRLVYGFLLQKQQKQLNKIQDKQNQLIHVTSNNIQQQLLRSNILIRFHASQLPYISMFCTNCVMNILKLYSQECNIKDKLRVCWKNQIFLGSIKIGQLNFMNYEKKDEIYTNIRIRIKLDYFTKNYQKFMKILIEEIIGEINVAINLNQVAIKIKQVYQDKLMHIDENVVIRKNNINHQQILVKGKFEGINNAGHAIINQIDKDQIITVEQGNMFKQYLI